MMRLLLARILMLGVVWLAVTSVAITQETNVVRSAQLNNVSLEIAALQVLHELELSPAQLTAWTKLAREAAPKGEKREPAKTSAGFAKALTALHEAYSKGDDAKIGEAREKLDALLEKEQPELDNSIQLTEAARDKAAEALKLLNVRQAGTFLSTLELTDPAELLAAALEQVRSLKGKERDDEIATVADEAAWLLDGMDGEEGEKIKDKVTAMLKRAAAIKSNGDFAKQKKSLEETIKGIIGDVDNTDVLGHILEHGVAELLSNPRLEAALRIQARVPAPAKPNNKTKPTSGKTPKP
jgi:hypothetical protein